jgi:3-phosphoshikimate 1-carboxyvinyltransferase
MNPEKEDFLGFILFFLERVDSHDARAYLTFFCVAPILFTFYLGQLLLMHISLHPISRLSGKISVPGDKSISHRSLFLGTLARGKTTVSHLLESQDVLSTWKCLEAMGADIYKYNDEIMIEGRGVQSFRKPAQPLDCGNSGTTMRLLMGVLAKCPFSTEIVGDDSLSRRPMNRIATPLTSMGAHIQLSRNEYAPLQICGTEELKSIHYDLPVASAQLKSALLLAGLFAEGETILRGKISSRDHMERLLPHFGVELKITEQTISISGGQDLRPIRVEVPGDISSAAFWIVAATIVPHSEIELNRVSLNPSRTGILRVLERMGARIEVDLTTPYPEPMGKINVKSASLNATTISNNEIPSLIDELPLIAILATLAEGTTTIRGAQELRVKETDRIEAIATNLRKMGVQIETFPDGFSITGPQALKGAKIHSFHDHRIAMAFSIAALISQGPTEICESDCVNISYPTFYKTLQTLSSPY